VTTTVTSAESTTEVETVSKDKAVHFPNRHRLLISRSPSLPLQAFGRAWRTSARLLR
jgi:hypothetical protein